MAFAANFRSRDLATTHLAICGNARHKVAAGLLARPFSFLRPIARPAPGAGATQPGRAEARPYKSGTMRVQRILCENAG